MHFQIKKKNIEGSSRYEYPQSAIHHSIEFAAISLFYCWSTNNWIFVLYRVVILVQFWGKMLMFNTHEITLLILSRETPVLLLVLSIFRTQLTLIVKYQIWLLQYRRLLEVLFHKNMYGKLVYHYIAHPGFFSYIYITSFSRNALLYQLSTYAT